MSQRLWKVHELDSGHAEANVSLIEGNPVDTG